MVERGSADATEQLTIAKSTENHRGNVVTKAHLYVLTRAHRASRGACRTAAASLMRKVSFERYRERFNGKYVVVREGASICCSADHDKKELRWDRH